MAAVTLTTLRALVRERADMTGSSFVTDVATSLDRWINEGCQRLHEKLVDAMGDQYVESSSALTLVAGTSDYNLPSDFYKLYEVELTLSGTVRTLMPFNRAERNALTSRIVTWQEVPQYRLAGSKIRILPTPQAAASGTMRYAPTFTVMSNGSDSCNFPDGWEKYVIVSAAIQALLKEESDVRDLRQELAQFEADFEKMKFDRDLQFPTSAVDLDMVDPPIGWRGPLGWRF